MNISFDFESFYLLVQVENIRRDFLIIIPAPRMVAVSMAAGVQLTTGNVQAVSSQRSSLQALQVAWMHLPRLFLLLLQKFLLSQFKGLLYLLGGSATVHSQNSPLILIKYTNTSTPIILVEHASRHGYLLRLNLVWFARHPPTSEYNILQVQSRWVSNKLPNDLISTRIHFLKSESI